MDQSFHERVVLITGANSGLGLAAAQSFGRAGARLILTGRDPVKLKAAAESIPGQPLFIPADITKPDEIAHLVQEAVARHGRIDVLINNAGGSMIAPFEFVRIEDARQLMETNFFGALHCTQAVLPHMLKQRSGLILNVASVGGVRGIPNLSIYSATKAALIAFSDSLRIELKDAGINVIVFATGRIRDTAIFDRAITYGPVKLYQVLDEVTPAEAAAEMLNAAAHGRPLTIIPRRARWLYHANKFFPRCIDRLLHQHMPRLQKHP